MDAVRLDSLDGIFSRIAGRRRERKGKSMKKILALKAALAGVCLALLLASCGSKAGSSALASYDETSYRDLGNAIDSGYISFFDDGTHLATFAYKDSAKLSDYAGLKSILTPTKKLAYEFLDLRGGVLLVREKGAPRPTPVRAIELGTGKDLLKKGFFSVATHAQESERRVILKKAGDRLSSEQLDMLQTTVEAMEEFAAKSLARGLAVEYYERYRFDSATRTADSLKAIQPSLYPRNILY